MLARLCCKGVVIRCSATNGSFPGVLLRLDLMEESGRIPVYDAFCYFATCYGATAYVLISSSFVVRSLLPSYESSVTMHLRIASWSRGLSLLYGSSLQVRLEV